MDRIPDPIRRPFSAGDLKNITLAIPILLACIVAYVGLAQWNHRPLKNLDTTAVRPINFQLDVNLADWAELTLLPGIGETLAKRIVDFRDQHGPFDNVQELRNVKGIGAASLDRIAPFIAPLNTTTTAAASIQQEVTVHGNSN